MIKEETHYEIYPFLRPGHNQFPCDFIQRKRRNAEHCPEGIQTILRREGYPNPYEALKALTRTNSEITESSIKEFISTLDVSDEVKAELLAITPHNYTGM